MKAISAPYNFVPLNEQVHLQDWGSLVSHDWPFEDGCSGEIHYTLIAESPLLVGGKQEKPPANDRANDMPGTEVKPFRLRDGRYAIPGSSLKGMIRSVVEIAGFGRMRMVDDRHLSVRDLTPGAREIYGKRMTRTVGDKTYEPRSKAGWLTLGEDGRARITPCQFARVEHDELARFADDDWWREVRREPQAERKYTRWQRRGRSLEVTFDLDGPRDHQHSKNRLRYGKAVSLGRGSDYRGRLVFTGQPSPRKREKPGCKHLEFIFYKEEKRQLEVPEEVWAAFRSIYAESDDWKYWREKERIPVFYLTNKQDEVDSLGLSLMYRLPYTNSIHDAIRNSTSAHLQEPGLEAGYDLADLLFGSINSQQQDQALKGRVSFEMALAENDEIEAQQQSDTILNSPKPSYYPNYICQKGEELGKSEQYSTLMDDDVKLRGFKRYPVRPEKMVRVQGLTQDQEGNKDVQIRLHTLPKGSRFSGRIVFHNLKPVELGALLWTLTWAGDPAKRHSLGMGKSFGFGQVRFEIDETASYQVANAEPGEAVSLLDKGGKIQLMNAFVDYMKQHFLNWERHPRINNLLLMADPEAAMCFRNGMELRHMRLSGSNEFVEAKKKKLVLADYAKVTKKTVSGQKSGPGKGVDLHSWVKERCTEICQKNHCEEHDAMKGKALAEAWSQIDDPELRKATWESIRAYWEDKDWWDAPQGKAMKVARKVYGDAP